MSNDRVTVRMPEELNGRLEDYTRDTGRTPTQVVLTAVDDHLAEHGYPNGNGDHETALQRVAGRLWRGAFIGAAIMFIVEAAMGLSGHLFGFTLFLVGLSVMAIWDAEPRVTTAFERLRHQGFRESRGDAS